MPNNTPLVRWLHISDMHFGCPGRGLWWQNKKDFEASVRLVVTESGPPDLVIITGDVANQGLEEEYQYADQFLDELLKWIREERQEPGDEPILLAVPGNHDLVRPAGPASFPYRVLDKFDLGRDDTDVSELMKMFWEGEQEYRKKATQDYLDPLFGPYRTWFERRIQPQLTDRAIASHYSHFPCDFSAELDLNGCRLAVVGLNSAWLQYKDGDFEKKLALPVEQYHAALTDGGGDPLELCDRCDQALLMMHHPPAWLSLKARKAFSEEIYRPDQFAVALFGHLHESRAETVMMSGGRARYLFQDASLFGLKHYGKETERKAISYSWASLTPEGVVRVRPMTRGTQGGDQIFLDDQEFPRETDGKYAQIAPVGLVTPAKQDDVDLTGYLDAVVSITAFINISGIGAGAGKVKEASRYPIEKLYTSLSCKAPLRIKGDDGPEVLAIHQGERDVSLKDLFAEQRWLYVEGQPGAGKTTFLRLAACCLARDSLGVECPDGVSWGAFYLGLDQNVDLPIFIRMSDMAALLADENAGIGMPDDRGRILDLLETQCRDLAEIPDRGYWNRRFEAGEAALLFDGLDEVGGERLRQRVFNIFRDACRHWGRCRIVVSSRPIQAQELKEMGFERTTLEPFGREEIGDFIERWMSALYGVEPGERLDPGGERRRSELESALIDVPRISLIATNPVMLTCLCVVHWNEGRLPKGRSRVYRAVLRWLIGSRSAQRIDNGFTDRFAELAFARLSLKMMETSSGSQASICLQDAADSIEPLALREFPDITPEDRRKRVRDWFGFETTWSGIVEELAGHQLRFWHLTLQEYFAAWQLALLGDGDEAGVDWWPILRKQLEERSWNETVEMFPGCLFDEGGESRVDLLLQRVLEIQGSAPSLAEEAKIVGLIDQLLRPLDVFGYQQNPELRAEYTATRERTMAIFEKDGASRVSESNRIAAAEVFGRTGDPRFCCTLGMGDESEHFLPVPKPAGWRLGKYPVTVGEFRVFHENGGYEQRKYWDEVGWRILTDEKGREPGDWRNQLDTLNRPIASVSWYEAFAYCRWLGEQLKLEVRLPSEEEWETAAKPERGEYPWGIEEPGPELANFGKRAGSTTPVGIYPAGAGPYNHLDLAGNVWEWCADEAEWEKWMDKYKETWDGGETARVLRGGSYWFDAENVRCTARGRLPAWSRNDSFGFRVLVGPASD